MKFEHFKKLQSRYWVGDTFSDPEELCKELSKKITSIEDRSFGVDEDVYIVTTQAKIIIHGLSLKIYEFIHQSIYLIENKQYITAIAILRLCLEHIAMLCFFYDKVQLNISNNDRLALRLLLISFCMGERIYFVDTSEKNSGKKVFSTRAEHVSSALRHFDKKYHGFGIQACYDLLSNHSHVSPTSSVRMLYRQKVWNKAEPTIDWRRIKLSTKSNSNEKTASAGVQIITVLFLFLEKKILNKQSILYKKLEEIGENIELNSNFNKTEDETIESVLSSHDQLVFEHLEKLKKYGTTGNLSK